MSEFRTWLQKDCRGKKALVSLAFGSALQYLGLGLMAGGMLALGAFAAPVVFRNIPVGEAGPVMATIFRRYDVVLMLSLALALVGEACRCRSRLLNCRGPVSVARLALLALLTAGVLFSTLKLNADIERMNRLGWHRDYTAEGRQFEQTHKLSEGIYKLNLLTALLLLVLTPFVPAAKAPEG